MKEIKVVIKDGQESKNSVGLQLRQTPHLWQTCMTTNKVDFSSGETITWKDKELGSCKIVKLDANSVSVQFWILMSSNGSNQDKICPASVEIVLNDEQNTSYILDELDCNYNGNQNLVEHTAKIQ